MNPEIIRGKFDIVGQTHVVGDTIILSSREWSGQLSFDILPPTGSEQSGTAKQTELFRYNDPGIAIARDGSLVAHDIVGHIHTQSTQGIAGIVEVGSRTGISDDIDKGFLPIGRIAKLAGAYRTGGEGFKTRIDDQVLGR